MIRSFDSVSCCCRSGIIRFSVLIKILFDGTCNFVMETKSLREEKVEAKKFLLEATFTSCSSPPKFLQIFLFAFGNKKHSEMFVKPFVLIPLIHFTEINLVFRRKPQLRNVDLRKGKLKIFKKSMTGVGIRWLTCICFLN